MNAGKALGQHGLESQILGRQRGVLAAGTLTLVFAPNHERALLLMRYGTFLIRFVDLPKSPLGNFWILLRQGKTVEPAGIISSVETSLPS
jgi:hypothetical protein